MKRLLLAVLLVFAFVVPSSAVILFTNNASSLVADVGGISDVDTSVTVTTGDGAEFPDPTDPDYFMATLVDVSGNREIVQVTARSTDTMTIVRAQEGTSARVYAQGSILSHRLTAGVLEVLAIGNIPNIDLYGGLEDAVLDIGATVTTVLCNTTQTIITDTTVPATLTILALQECSLEPANTKTLTMDSTPLAGDYSITGGAGTVTFAGPGIVWSAWTGGADAVPVSPRASTTTLGFVELATGQNIFSNPGFGLWTNSENLYTTAGTVPANNDGYAVVDDDAADDEKGDWSCSDCTIAWDTDHYEVTRTDNTQSVFLSTATYEAGKLYEFSAQVKDGDTGASEPIGFRFHDGDLQVSPDETTGAGWATITAVFRCVTSTVTGQAGLHISMTGAGDDIEFKDFKVHEVTPGIVGANALAFDGWLKSDTIAIFREYSGSNTKIGSFYSLKAIPSADGDFVTWPIGAIQDQEVFLDRFRGRTGTLGFWAKTSTPDDIRAGIRDGAVNFYSSYHTGGGDWEWLEITRTFGDASTLAFFRVHWDDGDQDGESYISQPMLIFGSSIGEGNYSAPAGEIISVETEISLYSGADDLSSDFTINLETQSDGKIPKGVKVVYGRLEGQNSAADKFMDILQSSGTLSTSRLYCQVAGKDASTTFRAICDTNESVYIDVEDGNWTNVAIKISAIEM